MKRFFVLFLLIPELVLPVRGETIRWVDFDVSYESMKYALEQDIPAGKAHFLDRHPCAGGLPHRGKVWSECGKTSSV